MARAAANLRTWCALDWPDIARLTSGNAAAQMGWTSKGRLTPGADADLVLLDDTCTVYTTVVAGLHFAETVNQSRFWSPIGAGSAARGWATLSVNFDF